MIRLVIYPESTSVEHIFSKDMIVIGCAENPETDLSFPDEDLDDVHIKIFFYNNAYVALNQANDPFSTLNGLPFGKKTLHHRDLLQIGKTVIRIELDPTPTNTPAKKSWGDTAHHIPSILEKSLESKKLFSSSHSMSASEESHYFDIDIDELVRQVELLEKQTPIEPIEKTREEPNPPSPKTIKSLKDDYLKYLDDDSEVEIDKFLSRKSQASQKIVTEEKHPHVRSFFKLLLIFLTLAGIFFSYWYYMLLERSQDEELKAARAVADISMALNYANFYQVRPQNQNWSDPEFLKSNLKAILSKSFRPMANLDNQGRFSDTPYLLRIYTSTDLNKFLVLAQPAPSWEQWIVPKHSIAVFLDSMELRKIIDLRILNRILLNAETLDGSGQHEINDFLHNSEMISLKTLITEDGTQGFAPPKALALFKPGAENYIYNAPRYYLFGESFVSRAVDLANNPDSVHELGLFRQQIDKLSQFSDIVLYSAAGLQSATEAKKALNAFLPDSSLAIAYLQFNSKGTMINSHLLFEDAQKEIATADPLAGKEPSITHPAYEEASDSLSIQLQALAKERQTALSPATETLIEVLRQELDAPTADFWKRFRIAYKQYASTLTALNQKVRERIVELEQENPKIPLCDFLSKTEQYNLGKIAKPMLEKKLSPEEMNCKNNDFEILLKRVDEAQSLLTLHDAVRDISRFLGIETIPDTEKLISYQGFTKGHVQKKLSQLLLSVDPHPTSNSFNSSDRKQLLSVLELAWITDPDEMNYYIQEFDLHAKNKLSEVSTEPKIKVLGRPVAR